MAEDKPHSQLFGSMSQALLSGGLGFRFQARGKSMAPAIQDGEILHVEPVAIKKLRKGDIVLFANRENYTAHRLVVANRVADVFITRGDAGLEMDAVLHGSEILGKVIGKEQNCDGRNRIVRLSGSRAHLRRSLLNVRGVMSRSVRAVLGENRANALRKLIPQKAFFSRLWMCLLLAFAAPSLMFGQVTVDSTTSSGARLTLLTPTLTFNHTTAVSTNLVLVVGVSVNITNNTSATVSTVTYNGSPLTRAGFVNESGNSRRVEIWYSVAPATGTHPVAVTLTIPGGLGTLGTFAGATTFIGADQTSPIRSFVSASGTTGTLASIDVPSAVNDMVMDTMATGGNRTVANPAGFGTTQAPQWNGVSGTLPTAGTDVYGTGSTRAGAPAVPLSETISGTSAWAVGAVSIRPLQADLAVSISGSSALYPANFAYTITVKNNGPSATTATLSDTLPSGLTLVSAVASQGACVGLTPIVCALGAIASGSTATVTLTVTPGAMGGYPNTASVTGTATDSNTGNNTATGLGFSQANTCTTPTSTNAPAALTGVINTYYPGTASVTTGASALVVGAATGATTPIAIGDLLLIIQMQNADINSTNSSVYGDGATGSGSTNLNNSGVYEFATATSALALAGGTVNISGAGPGGGLLYSYTTSAATATQGKFTFQVVRVPHYAAATLGTALTASAWNGSTGGVLSFDLEGALTLAGRTVSVNGLGFRGGAGLQLGGGGGANTDFLRAAPATYTPAGNPAPPATQAGQDGAKGEGIAGTPFWVQSGATFLSAGSSYPTGVAGADGSMARGAPGNAGGGGTDADPQGAVPGGNDQNSGGGGGGNGGPGGNGGNAWSANLSSGGLGGSAFPASVTRVALGGGGGAGSRNNSNGDLQASSGAAGGGIVIIRAGSLSGTGTISANGAAAYNATANDAGGGGGGGGSIIVLSSGGGEAGLTLTANGGRGGDAWNTNAFTLANRHGPGGGGGGGVVLVSGAPASLSVTGGANGVTETPGVPYGATAGIAGISATNVTLSSSPGPNSAAVPCTDVSITKTASPNPVRQGQILTYTLVVTNNGPTVASGVTVTDPLPTTSVAYLSSSSTQGTCAFAVVTVTCTIGTMNSGVTATITIQVTATTPSQAVNTAMVSETQADDVFANNFATQSELIETPTSVKLESFTAGSSPAGAMLSWKTGGEVRNLGFNVYREVNGQRVRVNPSLIAGSALIMRHALEQHGAKTYSWMDHSAGANNSLYWLEDVDVDGTRTFHGPISPGQNSLPESSARALTIPELNSSSEISGSSAASEVLEAVAIVSSSTPHQLQTQFQIASQSAIKIFVRHEGWYRVTQSQFVAAGMSASADPTTLRLFAEGVEQPIRIAGAWAGGPGPSAIEFYGTGIDTFYSDKRVYWLTSGNQSGLRIAQHGYQAGGPQAQSFPRTVVLNQRTTYFAALLKENTDNFFGALVSPAAVDQVLRAANVAAVATGDVSLRIALQGVTEEQPHDVTIVMNGSTLGELKFFGQAEGTITLRVPAGLLHSGANTVTLTAQNGENDLSVVDFITLTYPHTYTAEADSLKFTAQAGDHVVVNGFLQPPTTLVDITNPARPIELAAQVGSANGKFTLEGKVPSLGGGTHTLLALSDHRIAAASGLLRNNPSSLHNPQPGSEVVMISAPEFAGRLNPLLQMHRAEGKTVAIVDVNDIYDEFNFGERSPYALRTFLQTATAQWKNSPKYLLLVGDASLDPRNYLGIGSFDLVPTKMIVTRELKTASDDWFSDFDNTGYAQIATGRLPVRTQEDAATVIGKIAGYAGSQSGSWTNQTLMVADRDDSINFTGQTQAAQRLLPKSMNVLDVFGSTLDADSAKQQIIAGINAGDLLVNYTGHGSVEVWSGDNLFDGASATTLTNGTRLPVFLIMNCLNGFFQDVYTQSLAESLLLARNGGAVAVWASSGLNQANPQANMDKLMVRSLFTQPSPALGDAINQAKRGIGDPDVRRTYILFGDPLMKLKWPSEANTQ